MIKKSPESPRSESLLSAMRYQAMPSEFTPFLSPLLMSQETQQLISLFADEERLAPLISSSTETGPNDKTVPQSLLNECIIVAKKLARRGMTTYLVPNDEILDIKEIYEVEISQHTISYSTDPDALYTPWEARFLVTIAYLSNLPHETV